MSTAMFLPSSIFHFICLVLIQIIITNVVRGEYLTPYDNATNDASQRESGRSKRSLFDDMPGTIKIRIAYSTKEIIELKWIKQNPYLSNEHLPVSMSGHLNPNVMRDVGDFVVYYDLEKCSSVVYFKKLNALFGYIGMGYFITYLPYKFDPITGYYPEIVREPYVKERSNAPSHIASSLSDRGILRSPLERSSDGSFVGIKRSLDSDHCSTSKHQRINRDLSEKINEVKAYANMSKDSHIRKRRGNSSTKQYFLETLVFVSQDIVNMFKGSFQANDYLAWTVRYCIIYFSGVDMIFQKIKVKRLNLHINIAKIVIEHEARKPFYSIINGELQFSETTASIREYLHTYRNGYVPDSFDHVFLITSLPIIHDSNLVPAMSEYHPDLYEKRQEDQFYNAVPVTVVGHDTDYALGVHAISRTFNIEPESRVERLGNPGQCSSIMQEGNSKCDGCLKWSGNDKKQFEAFFYENRNRCFLLNQPRSLRPPGPSKCLTPLQQCRCFGYVSFIVRPNGRQDNNVKADECDVPLRCRKVDGDRSVYDYTISPFDGTPCGKNTKVCWNGECASPISASHKI